MPLGFHLKNDHDIVKISNLKKNVFPKGGGEGPAGIIGVLVQI